MHHRAHNIWGFIKTTLMLFFSSSSSGTDIQPPLPTPHFLGGVLASVFLHSFLSYHVTPLSPLSLPPHCLFIGFWFLQLLKPEDLELGRIDESKHVTFVCLGLHHLSPTVIFSSSII